uniref:Cysteine dioxygenase n=1 Tax=Petromyzon marinus TaxID=7757 RepID=A0AAJ7T0Z6_PETMA|nr:cysteine dioxygenase type 1 [Petromyzon marinus]
MESSSSSSIVKGKLRSLDELISVLHELFSGDKVDVDEVKAVMASYPHDATDWERFAKFDKFRYTRNLVDEGNGKFNLMLLCWGEGHGSSIHDHMDAHCFVKIMQGQLKETMYEWPTPSTKKQELIKKSENLYSEDQVTYINDSIGLHRVENVSHSETAISLHLYSPPFSSCHCFDERTGHKNEVQMTFYSKYGERTPFEVKATAEDN